MAHHPGARVIPQHTAQTLLSFVGAIGNDNHTRVLEGSALAIPRRLAVVDEDYPRARRVLIEAGEDLPE